MKRLLLIFMMLLGTLYATPLTLDEQIAQLQHADSKERFELMNALKLRISTMNADERSGAINKLKTQMNKNSTPNKNASMQQHQQMLATDQMQQMRKQNHGQASPAGTGNPNKPSNGHGNSNR